MSVLEEFYGDISEYEYQKKQERKRERKRKRNAEIIKALEDVKAEIILLSDKADRECKVSNSYSVRDRLRTKAQAYDDVAKMIDRKIKEIKHE